MSPCSEESGEGLIKVPGSSAPLGDGSGARRAKAEDAMRCQPVLSLPKGAVQLCSGSGSSDTDSLQARRQRAVSSGPLGRSAAGLLALANEQVLERRCTMGRGRVRVADWRRTSLLATGYTTAQCSGERATETKELGQTLATVPRLKYRHGWRQLVTRCKSSG